MYRRRRRGANGGEVRRVRIDGGGALSVRLYHGDCLEIMRGFSLTDADALVTDPPYPNNAGHFLDGIDAARSVLCRLVLKTALVFWSELEQPPVNLPLVAVHIWHRTNVNGRPYEPIYHFDADKRKRRSEVKVHAAIFNGAGPGCHEYAGHPTQKPVAFMGWLLDKAGLKPGATVIDPFMGSGSTGIACVQRQINFIGIEADEQFFCTAQKRIRDAQAQGNLFDAEEEEAA